MNEKARKAYADWKQADVEARTKEAELDLSWEQYFRHSGAPPTAQLMQEVSRLRLASNDRLTALRLQMDLR